MGWENRQYHRREEATFFPFIQVFHSPGQLEPRPETGGFFQPHTEAQVLGASIPGTLTTFHCGGSKQIEGTFTPELTIAVLETREILVTGRGEGARRVEAFGPGVHSKVQVACLVRTEGGGAAGPATLTVKSTVAGAFWRTYKAHRSNVREAAGGKAPAYAFWLPFRATGTNQTGEGGTVTVFEHGGHGFDPDQAFVGDEPLDRLNWDELDAWAAAWNNGSGNGGLPDPNGPATQAQWRFIRDLLQRLNYKSEEQQTAAIAKAGYDPANLCLRQASELITRLQAAAAK
jgi:hypothetical protein